MAITDLTKKISHSFEIIEKYDAGIVLVGQEVKSIKSGRITLDGAFVVMKDNELFLIGADVPPWQPKNSPFGYNSQRSRKLLVTKKELSRLSGKIKQKGLTIKPVSVYTQNGKIKVQFALLKNKKKFDRREEIKKREAKIEIERVMKNN